MLTTLAASARFAAFMGSGRPTIWSVRRNT